MANSEVSVDPETESGTDNQPHRDVNPALFLSLTGHSIEFFLDVKDVGEKITLAELIDDYGGTYIDSEENITEWTVIMTESPCVFNCDKPLFRKNYIKDCVEQNTLLDISKYAFSYDSNCKTSLMDVIFWRKRSFAKEPLISSSTSNAISKDKNKEFTNKAVSIVPVNQYMKSQRQHNRKTLVSLKSTREPYSKKEKEDILRFLIQKERFDRLKGSSIWKNMEVRNICPKRTYQSLKEHFMKVIIYQLDQFDFLTQEQKDKFRAGFFQ